MKFIKKALRYIIIFIIGLVGFVVLYFTFAYLLSRITVNNTDTELDEMTIYIKTNGVHTDIVMPIKSEIIDWSKQIRFENTRSKDTTYKFVALGWGDKGFYLETPTWDDLTLPVAFKAVTGLSTTAFHATFYHKMTINDSCKKIEISKNQYISLINFIEESMQIKNGKYINIPTNAVYGDSDAFYEANGSYSLFTTCNTWSNNALKSCGQKACLWTPFDTGIFLKYQ